jgi:hypothetical protein
MEFSANRSRANWKHPYVVLLFVAVGALCVSLVPSIFERPDLAVLEPIGRMMFFASLPALPLLTRFEQGTLTRGTLLLFLLVYLLIGAGCGIAVYEEIRGL